MACEGVYSPCPGDIPLSVMSLRFQACKIRYVCFSRYEAFLSCEILNKLRGIDLARKQEFYPAKVAVFADFIRQDNYSYMRRRNMLTQITLLLTYQCTLECDHCYFYCGPRAKGTLTLDQRGS